MHKLIHRVLLLLGALIVTSIIAIAVQYHLRLRLAIGEPIVVGFSKGAWVECLPDPVLVGQIKAVRLDGVVFADTSGSFTSANLRGQATNGAEVCERISGIVIDDANAKHYFVRFQFIGGLRKSHSDQWFWTNPFAT